MLFMDYITRWKTRKNTVAYHKTLQRLKRNYEYKLWKNSMPSNSLMTTLKDK